MQKAYWSLRAPLARVPVRDNAGRWTVTPNDARGGKRGEGAKHLVLGARRFEMVSPLRLRAMLGSMEGCPASPPKVCRRGIAFPSGGGFPRRVPERPRTEGWSKAVDSFLGGVRVIRSKRDHPETPSTDFL